MASDSHHPQHPSISQYWKIAGLLAVLTASGQPLYDDALELGALNVAMLLILAALKFVIVVGWYMHLRFERPMLNRFFAAGFILALGLYGVVLAAMGIVAIRGS